MTTEAFVELLVKIVNGTFLCDWCTQKLWSLYPGHIGRMRSATLTSLATEYCR